MLTLKGIRLQQGNFALTANLAFTAQVTALLGPSGAGKSSLLNVIAGFIKPTNGQVLWHDKDITNRAPAQRPVAMLFQDNNLFPHLTVQANLALALTHKRPNDAQIAQIEAVLKRVDLSGYEARKPAALSGGQQSRVALARVLLQARPLILLDEPFAALGPALKREMLDLVAEVSAEAGMQVIMVSHDPQDASRIAGHSAVVSDGVVTAPTETDALLSNPPKALGDYL